MDYSKDQGQDKQVWSALLVENKDNTIAPEYWSNYNEKHTYSINKNPNLMNDFKSETSRSIVI